MDYEGCCEIKSTKDMDGDDSSTLIQLAEAKMDSAPEAKNDPLKEYERAEVEAILRRYIGQIRSCLWEDALKRNGL